MTKKKPRDTGEEFIQGILEKVPEEKREQLKSLLSDDEVLSYAGEHVLMRDEFSRGMDGIKTAREQVKARQDQLDSWWQANSAALTEHPKLQKELDELRTKVAAGAGGGGEDLDEDALKLKLDELTKKMVTKEEGVKTVRDALNESEGRMLSFLDKIQPLSHRHSKSFDEPLNVSGLVEFSVKHGINDLEDAYSKFYSEKLAEQRQKLEAEREKKLRADIRKELEEEARKNGAPYPISRREGLGPSTLSGLMTKGDEPTVGVKAAVDAYYREGQ